MTTNTLTRDKWDHPYREGDLVNNGTGIWRLREALGMGLYVSVTRFKATSRRYPDDCINFRVSEVNEWEILSRGSPEDPVPVNFEPVRDEAGRPVLDPCEACRTREVVYVGKRRLCLDCSSSDPSLRGRPVDMDKTHCCGVSEAGYACGCEKPVRRTLEIAGITHGESVLPDVTETRSITGCDVVVDLWGNGQPWISCASHGGFGVALLYGGKVRVVRISDEELQAENGLMDRGLPERKRIAQAFRSVLIRKVKEMGRQ